MYADVYLCTNRHGCTCSCMHVNIHACVDACMRKCACVQMCADKHVVYVCKYRCSVYTCVNAWVLFFIGGFCNLHYFIYAYFQQIYFKLHLNNYNCLSMVANGIEVSSLKVRDPLQAIRNGK